MASTEEELILKIKTEGGDDAADQVDSLSESLEELGEQSENTTSKIESYTEILENSIGIAQDVFNGIVALTEAIQEAAQEYERIASVVRNFDGDVTEASDAVNGFISDLDIMTASNRAAQAGLNLSANELRSVSVAAVRMAQATGGDAKQALDQLTEALIGASADGLQKFNIQIEASGNKTRDQINALNALTERYGDAQVEIQSFTQLLVNSDTQLENMKTGLVRGAESVQVLDDAFNRLNATMTLINGSNFNWMTDMEMHGARLAGVLAGIMNYLNGIINLNREALQGGLLNAIRQGASQGELELRNARDLQARQDQITNEVMPDVRANIARFEANTAEGGGGGQDRENFFDAQQRMIDELNAAMEPLLAAQEESFQTILRQTQALGEETPLMDHLRLLSEERANSEKEIVNQRQQAIQLADQENQAIMRNLEADQRRLQVLHEAQENATRYQNIQSGVAEGAQQLFTVSQAAFDNIKNQNMSIGEGIRVAAKGWLKQFGKQEMMKGVSATAEAVGFTITNPPAAGSKYAEAGIHFGLAALAGGAGAAIKGGSKPSGGGSASSGKGQGMANNEGPSQNITINIQGQMYMTEAQIGRAINDGLAAYQRRY